VQPNPIGARSISVGVLPSSACPHKQASGCRSPEMPCVSSHAGPYQKLGLTCHYHASTMTTRSLTACGPKRACSPFPPHVFFSLSLFKFNDRFVQTPLYAKGGLGHTKDCPGNPNCRLLPLASTAAAKACLILCSRLQHWPLEIPCPGRKMTESALSWKHTQSISCLILVRCVSLGLLPLPHLLTLSLCCYDGAVSHSFLSRCH